MKPDSMRFNVGPFVYTLYVSNRQIHNSEGDELEGVAIEEKRIILVSKIILPERREEIARHEVLHCWHFHVPKPKDDEEQCQLFAFVSMQFDRDLEAQGGSDALCRLRRRYIPYRDACRPRLVDRVNSLEAEVASLKIALSRADTKGAQSA